MRIVISNVPDDVTGEDVKEIFADQGLTVETQMMMTDVRICDVLIEGVDRAAAEAIAEEFLVHHRYWKGHAISVNVPIYAQPST
jgi:hypothetical protein